MQDLPALPAVSCPQCSSACEGEVIVQGDEGPVCGVAQVVDCHGDTVGHQEREEVEEQQEVEGEGEKHSRTITHAHGCDEGEKTSASGLEPCGVMNDQTKTQKTACKCAQFCMLRMSTCVASFMLLSTMVSKVLKVYLSLYTLLRIHLSFA